MERIKKRREKSSRPIGTYKSALATESPAAYRQLKSKEENEKPVLSNRSISIEILLLPGDTSENKIWVKYLGFFVIFSSKFYYYQVVCPKIRTGSNIWDFLQSFDISNVSNSFDSEKF